MKALLIDDERLARSELRRLLAEYPEIEIVGEASNTKQAKEQMATVPPEGTSGKLVPVGRGVFAAPAVAGGTDQHLGIGQVRAFSEIKLHQALLHPCGVAGRP